MSKRQVEIKRDNGKDSALIHWPVSQTITVDGAELVWEPRVMNSKQGSHLGGRNSFSESLSLPPSVCISKKPVSREGAGYETWELQYGKQFII